MTNGRALLLALVIFALGGGAWALLRAGGVEGFTPGIAASSLLMLLVLGWTGSYLLRVVSGKMTYMEQRRNYRAGYDALTDAELQRRFEALPPAEQQRLLQEIAAPGPEAEG